jgi:hypothetical protein
LPGYSLILPLAAAFDFLVGGKSEQWHDAISNDG